MHLCLSLSMGLWANLVFLGNAWHISTILRESAHLTLKTHPWKNTMCMVDIQTWQRQSILFILINDLSWLPRTMLKIELLFTNEPLSDFMVQNYPVSQEKNRPHLIQFFNVMPISNTETLYGFIKSYQGHHIMHHWQEMSTSCPLRECSWRNRALFNVPLGALPKQAHIQLPDTSSHPIPTLAYIQCLQLSLGVS